MKNESSYKNLLRRHQKVMSERGLITNQLRYYKNRCKELEAERKQLKRELAQFGMLLDVKLDKIRSDVR